MSSSNNGNGKGRGRLLGVGVGPGDPGLMTIRAAETIKGCGALALPKGRDDAMSFRIAAQAVPEAAGKPCIELDIPMTRDQGALKRAYDGAADRIAEALDAGRDVAFLTIGDPTVYSTYMRIHRRIVQRGYEAEIVSGVPSFCAAAARLGVSLCEGEEQLHVLPAGSVTGLSGTKVLMKTGASMREYRRAFAQRGVTVRAVSNCGLPEERIYEDPEDVPEDAGYMILLIIKDSDDDR